MKFTADDFEASNAKGRQPLASERYLEAPQKAADYFNKLYRRLLKEKYKLQVTYDDFVTYAYATKSISYTLIYTLWYPFHQDGDDKDGDDEGGDDEDGDDDYSPPEIF